MIDPTELRRAITDAITDSRDRGEIAHLVALADRAEVELAIGDASPGEFGTATGGGMHPGESHFVEAWELLDGEDPRWRIRVSITPED